MFYLHSRNKSIFLCAALLGGAICQAAPGPALLVRGDTSMQSFLDPWLESFRKLHPEIEVKVEMGHGAPENRSAVGPDVAALFQKTDEQFYRQYGYAPLNIVVSGGGRHVVGKIQAIGVFVHPDNPLRHLTLQQVEAIFSISPRDGRPPITKWGQLGLTGEWAERPIVAFGRERKQGASNHFRNRALGGADYTKHYRECANSTKVVEAVAADPAAIGYSALAYATPQVRALALAERDGAPVGQPTEVDSQALLYPLAYPLYLSVNRAPGRSLDPAIKAFLAYVLSPAGQELVGKAGFLPLSPDALKWERLKFE
ncbi:MAG: substrate-binding domain-containing protein [Opitutaceae bacterium]|nr:substrate-binding domain-containing protein [Opitutaceae bacterium]